MAFYVKLKPSSKRYTKKTVHRVEITDCIGNEICPGMIVAYSTGSKLKFGVYEGVAVTGTTKKKQYRVQLCQADGLKVRRNIVGYLKYNKENDDYSPAENLVAVKNPLYHLGNEDIASCLQAIDVLKDKGYLPNDFKLS